MKSYRNKKPQKNSKKDNLHQDNPYFWQNDKFYTKRWNFLNQHIESGTVLFHTRYEYFAIFAYVDNGEPYFASLWTECITREDKNGKEILMYYFNPTTANNNHYFYGCMFTGTDDIIRHLKGEEDEYTKFWNTLSSDPSFRTAVGKRVDSGLISYNPSGTLHDHDVREDIIPGVYSYRYPISIVLLGCILLIFVSPNRPRPGRDWCCRYTQVT